MARRAAGSWPGYIRELLQLWDVLELGPDFKVGGTTRADVEALEQKISGSLEQIEQLEFELRRAIAEREKVIRDLERFAVQFRMAVAIEHGLRSPQMRMVPKVAAPPKGKRRKKTDEESSKEPEKDETKNKDV